MLIRFTSMLRIIAKVVPKKFKQSRYYTDAKIEKFFQ